MKKNIITCLMLTYMISNICSPVVALDIKEDVENNVEIQEVTDTSNSENDLNNFNTTLNDGVIGEEESFVDTQNNSIVSVSTEEELKNAISDISVSEIDVTGDIELNNSISIKNRTSNLKISGGKLIFKNTSSLVELISIVSSENITIENNIESAENSSNDFFIINKSKNINITSEITTNNSKQYDSLEALNVSDSENINAKININYTLKNNSLGTPLIKAVDTNNINITSNIISGSDKIGKYMTLSGTTAIVNLSGFNNFYQKLNDIESSLDSSYITVKSSTKNISNVIFNIQNIDNLSKLKPQSFVSVIEDSSIGTNSISIKSNNADILKLLTKTYEVESNGIKRYAYNFKGKDDLQVYEYIKNIDDLYKNFLKGEVNNESYCKFVSYCYTSYDALIELINTGVLETSISTSEISYIWDIRDDKYVSNTGNIFGVTENLKSLISESAKDSELTSFVTLAGNAFGSLSISKENTSLLANKNITLNTIYFEDWGKLLTTYRITPDIAKYMADKNLGISFQPYTNIHTEGTVIDLDFDISLTGTLKKINEYLNANNKKMDIVVGNLSIYANKLVQVYTKLDNSNEKYYGEVAIDSNGNLPIKLDGTFDEISIHLKESSSKKVTVNFIDKNTGLSISPSYIDDELEIGSRIYEAKSISGYTLIGEQTKVVNITEEKDDYVVTFEYSKIKSTDDNTDKNNTNNNTNNSTNNSTNTDKLPDTGGSHNILFMVSGLSIVGGLAALLKFKKKTK